MVSLFPHILFLIEVVKLYVVKIMNEFLHGPVWVYYDGIAVRNFPLIYGDPIIKDLNDQANEMFSAYYEFDSHDVACWFNSEKERAEKTQMLSIINKIIERLAEINDGSFVVEDYETPKLNAL